MTTNQLKELESELARFLELMLSGIGRRETRENLSHYVHGLLLDGDRKSMQPMARRLAKSETEAEAVRQQLQQGICVCPWDDSPIYKRLAQVALEKFKGWEAWVLDDTGFPKKGTHSVGVQRQYSGTLGQKGNCQVAVSLHLAAADTSLCTGMRLYLPSVWADDLARRTEAQVPANIVFKEKWRLALDLLDNVPAAFTKKPVLGDAAYGNNALFRKALRDRRLPYLLAIRGDTVVWSPLAKPKVPSKGTLRRRGRYIDEKHPAIAVEALASTLRYRKVIWREGSRGPQSSRFAAVRIRTAQNHTAGYPPGEEEWLLCEWPLDEKAPTKFYLSNLPVTTSLRKLVRLARLRWRVERDYQEMKQEIGLDHFEGRTWRGFHHHIAICAIAHAFLALQRALFPPEEQNLVAA
jgi:SRSO17 transposase